MDKLRRMLNEVEAAGASSGMSFHRRPVGSDAAQVDFGMYGSGAETEFSVLVTFSDDVHVRVTILRPGERMRGGMPSDAFRTHPDRSMSVAYDDRPGWEALIARVRREAERHVAPGTRVEPGDRHDARLRALLAEGGQAMLRAFVRAVDDLGVRDVLVEELEATAAPAPKA